MENQAIPKRNLCNFEGCISKTMNKYCHRHKGLQEISEKAIVNQATEQMSFCSFPLCRTRTKKGLCWNHNYNTINKQREANRKYRESDKGREVIYRNKIRHQDKGNVLPEVSEGNQCI